MVDPFDVGQQHFQGPCQCFDVVEWYLDVTFQYFLLNKTWWALKVIWQIVAKKTDRGNSSVWAG